MYSQHPLWGYGMREMAEKAYKGGRTVTTPAQYYSIRIAPASRSRTSSRGCHQNRFEMASLCVKNLMAGLAGTELAACCNLSN